MTTQELAQKIDHTCLKADATFSDIEQCCAEAREQSFYAVCVNPQFVSLCKQLLKGSAVKVCTVIGFPLGANNSLTKIFETRQALQDGADEVDMVINISALKSSRLDLVQNDIAGVVQAAKGKTVKVIIETHLLNREEKISACQLAKSAGAQFVKTSTGFLGGGATVEDVRLMKDTVGTKMQVKASGGIRDVRALESMLAAGASRIGTSQGVSILKGQRSSGGY